MATEVEAIVEVADHEVEAIVEVADQGINAAKKALDLYNEMIDTIIPWDDFNKTINELKQSKDAYSAEAAILVGTVQTLLEDSHDSYDESNQGVYRWCKLAVPLLTQYIELFAKTTDPGVAEGQKVLLLKVLDDGEAAMDKAIVTLETSKRSFNRASGELTTLSKVLAKNFEDGSAYKADAVAKMRTSAYIGSAAGVVGGPVGLALSYSVAAIVVEAALIPALEQAFAETEQRFKDLHAMVNKAQTEIISAKKSISEEIRAIGVMSAKVVETETFATTWAIIPTVMFDALKTSTKELITLCNQYIENKEKKVKE